MDSIPKISTKKTNLIFKNFGNSEVIWVYYPLQGLSGNYILCLLFDCLVLSLSVEDVFKGRLQEIPRINC